MGKINRFANIYDKDGNLLRHTDEDGKLKNYTISELEELVDKLAEDKDEEGHVKDPQSLNNVYSVLSEEYRKHPNYLIQKLQELNKLKNTEGSIMAEKTTPEEIEKALSVSSRPPKQDDSEQLVERETDYEPEQYVQFEEITDSDESSKEMKEAA